MSKKFVFKKNQSIGASAAELDRHYLSECFVDTGDLAILCDCDDPRRILLGRTGAGKSALVWRMAQTEEHVVRIQPETLSLKYVANSNVLKFFSEAGVHMDIFFRLLWRHVLSVEVIKLKYQIDSESKSRNFFDQVWNLIHRSPKHEKAIDYLREWGDSFWKDTDIRVKEVTQKLESKLSGAVEGKLPGIGALSAAAASTLSEEKKGEVVHLAQEVVNKVQLKELSTIIDVLEDLFSANPQQRFYITIDQLDEDWIEDHLRFRLIRALVTTAIDFGNLKQLKIVVAIRQDLLDRVFRYTRGPGFQEEKLRASILEITWDTNRLSQILDSRVNLLVREQYTNAPVTHKDLLPPKIGNTNTTEYMLERTFMRPRDIIHFFNTGITYSDGQASISKKNLLEAEGAYSRDRLRALADEWYGLYPNLFHLSQVLKQRNQRFKVGDLPLSDLETNLLQIWLSGEAKEGLDADCMRQVWESKIAFSQYRTNLVNIFYRVGLVGLKTDPYLPVSWSYEKGVNVSSAELTDDTFIYVHKAFWRTLGVLGKAVQ